MKETDDNKNAETGNSTRYNNIPNSENGETIKITEATKKATPKNRRFKALSACISSADFFQPVFISRLRA